MAATPPATFRGEANATGLAIKIRSALEKDFSASTKQLGFEYLRDKDVGLLLTVNEEGGVGVVSRPTFAVAGLAYSTNCVLIRYNVYTGEAVISDGTAWKTIKDSDPLPAGTYEVRITGPFKVGDVESYNILRLETNSGASWYSVNNEWQPYTEPVPQLVRYVVCNLRQFAG